MSTLSETDGYRRIKRASRACQRCHSRKVRCDATVTGYPCTNCRLDANSCLAFSGGRDRKKQKTIARAHLRTDKDSRKHPAPSRADPQRAAVPAGVKRPYAVQVPFSSYAFLHSLSANRFKQAGISVLGARGCLSFPNKAELDIFIRHYFLYVHPFTPLFDEAEFWRVYQNRLTCDMRLSIFLFRAMIFAASCFVPTEVARRCGYSSLLEARDDLYRKTKLLYESSIEKDQLTIARAAILLTYYSSDSEVEANSEWLRIAISHTRAIQAVEPRSKSLSPAVRTSQFKRLWWCCLVRDRIISLGMRRPIQISRGDPGLYLPMLTTEDMNGEIFNSMVYSYEIKSALFELFTSLCHFVISATDLTMIAFVSTRDLSSETEDQDSTGELSKLETAKSSLLLWELDWLALMEVRNTDLYGPIPLFSSLLSIYYQSARVALCNRVCLVLSKVIDSTSRYLQHLDFCRSELVAAIESIADKVKHLISIKAVDKLPISVAAYTTTPFILLAINSQSDTAQTQEILDLLTAIHASLGLRYHITRVANLTSRALWLSRLFKARAVGLEKALEMSSQNNSSRNIFTLPLRRYNQLLQYVDYSMSLPQDSAQETEMFYAAASTPGEADLYHGTTNRDVSRQAREHTPVWMESMEHFFFGPGRLLSFSSSNPRAESEEPPNPQAECDGTAPGSLGLPFAIQTSLSLLEE
ncbi:hypothetical protein BDV19DRAFT_395316 [Aspergillus venezuelensis]